MPFNSFPFLFLFLPAAAIVYYKSAHHFSARTASIVLALSSLIFYSLGNLAHTALLLGSILFNYGASQIIVRSSGAARRRWLILGLTANIALLGALKYSIFFLHSLAVLWKPIFIIPQWALPLGISFFTLQQVMYLVDCYEGLVPANDLWTHAAFVSFFPTVISGPITRARLLPPQIRQAVTTDAGKIAQALTLLALGLFKKVVIADSFSRIADAGFAHPAGVSTLEAWVSSFAFTFQIYFDFSGYTDLATGAALLLGFTLPINFDTPYRSHSVTEFWQRWHITLSQFITTYLYTPILRTFKKVSLAKASFATLLAMTITGLWHGPSWTFVIFGALHGIALVVNQIWRKKIKKAVPGPFAWAATLVFVNTAFIFFRSTDVHSAVQMIGALAPHHGFRSLAILRGSIRTAELGVIALPMLIGVPAALLGTNSVALSRQIKPRLATAWAVASLMLVSLLYMNSNLAKEFVYFKF